MTDRPPPRTHRQDERVTVHHGDALDNPEPACDPARNDGRVIGKTDAEVSAFVETAEQAVALFEGAWLTSDMQREARTELAGRNLACWCPLDQPCHADVLLVVANSPAPVSQEGGNQ